MAEVQLEASWKARLDSEFEKPYMKQLKAFLVAEKRQGKVIYPKGADYFKALNLTPFESVKVVILGQDPYHGPQQAHGLCFSVPEGVPFPPSLRNIFQEINQELGLPIPTSGCLTSWAEQGVLLLNSVLTVEQQQAASHKDQGWETFTDAIIHALNAEREGIVFMLWGAYAQKKGSFITADKHCVLKSPHPSPLSAHRGFFGNNHFVQCNEYLEQCGVAPIDWRVPS